MTYSATHTATATFTKTSAEHLAGRIAAELNQVKLGYEGVPSDEDIIKYAQEAAILLHHKLLKSVKYGFKRNDSWALVLEYTTNYLGQIQADHLPGDIPMSANITGATWYTHLQTRSTDHSQEELRAIEASIPIKRDVGVEPSFTGGQWGDNKQFSKDGGGLGRRVYWS